MQARRPLALLLPLLVVLGLAAPCPGLASTATLQRSVQNIVLAPADLLLAPLVAGRVIHRNLQRSDDALAVKALFLVPGFCWNTGVQLGAALVREVTGLLELLPGLVLLPLDAELPLLFAPAEHGDALVDVETRALHIRFGVDYLTLPR